MTPTAREQQLIDALDAQVKEIEKLKAELVEVHDDNVNLTSRNEDAVATVERLTGELTEARLAVIEAGRLCSLEVAEEIEKAREKALEEAAQCVEGCRRCTGVVDPHDGDHCGCDEVAVEVIRALAKKGG